MRIPELTPGMPRLSIIIVSYNSATDLGGCLHSLTDAPPRIDHEIVVVDNDSSDGTADYLRHRWPGIRLIEAGGNLGFARANNLGIRQTFGELVLLLNPDTVVPRGELDRLIAAIDADPSAAVAGPRIVDANGRAELSFGPMISPLSELQQKVIIRMTSIVERRASDPKYVDWVSGACLLIRRVDLEDAGLLDERFFMYLEDVDLCAAVRRRGHRVLFAPAAHIVHVRGRSARSAPAATEAAYRRSQIAFYEKHHPGWVWLLRAYLKIRGRLPDKSSTS
jgi:N-acetylglucosaminyl-diphospho-decaprenol L-rhamnosyltransferase